MVVNKEINIDVEKHILVPKHVILSDKEKKSLYDLYKINEFNLPKILSTDAAIKKLNAAVGDIIKIERTSVTAGKSIYYRAVI